MTNTKACIMLLFCHYQQLRVICSYKQEHRTVGAKQRNRTSCVCRVSVTIKTLYYPTYLLTHLLTYLLTPRCRVLFEKLTGLQLVNKFPAFHGTRRSITALTSVRHLSHIILLRDASPGNTPPPRDPSGGVVYLRVVLTPEESTSM